MSTCLITYINMTSVMSAKRTFAILGVIVTLSIVVAGSLSYPALAAKSNSNSSHGNTKVGDTSPKTSSSDTSSPKTSSSNAGQTSMGDFLSCLSATDKKGFLKFNAIDCFTTLG